MIGKLVEGIPEIIKALVDNPVGLLGLVVILITAITYTFFRKAQLWARVLAVLLMFAGSVALAAAVAKGIKTPCPVVLWSARDVSREERTAWSGPNAPNCDCLHVKHPRDLFPSMWAEYNIPFDLPGQYKFFVTYASAEARPVIVKWNARPVLTQAMSNYTGGWENGNMQTEDQGIQVEAKRGNNILRIERGNDIPHINSFKFVRVD